MSQQNEHKDNNLVHPEQYKDTFFIKRPVLATVISLLIVLVGFISIRNLPIAQYPDLIPPTVTVTAQYPGASPETLAETVARPLEQQINGVDNMIYMTTTTSAAGFLTITVTFELGTDPDIATINVNNRVQAGMISLPEDVRRYGVLVKKSSPAILQMIMLTSPDSFFDAIYLSNFALTSVVDNLKRIKGVGDASIIGAKEYSMRIWLKPEKLQYFQLTPSDIAMAIRDQNAQYAAGKIGAMPAPDSVEITWQINAQGRLVTVEEFENIIIRSNADGGILRLSDVARVELGSGNYDVDNTLNGQDAVPIMISLAPGANALETADLVEEEMARLAQNFPYGVEYSIPYDTTIFVRISIEEVIKTLFEAMVLVFLVVYLFLQNWRATLIPCIAVPISIIGTFAGMELLGFTINTLTLFGLVLAIGIVVDDAIIVLENVERILSSNPHLTVRQATSKTMREVSGPIVAVVLVLCAVFIPIAFLGGLAGEMYRQFAITISVSVAISGLVALTLTPALCITFLKQGHSKPLAFFIWFNNFFEKITNGFTNNVKRFLKSSALTLAVFGVICVLTVRLFQVVPTGLVPDEDQGYVMALILLPEGSALTQTVEVSDRIAEQIRNKKGVKNLMALAGYNIMSGLSTNSSTLFITLDDWSERAKMGFDLRSFLYGIYGMNANEVNALILPFNPPPISGMSNTGGFEMFIQSQSGNVKELADVTREFIAKANALPELNSVSTTINTTAPRLFIELDRENARALKVNVSDVFQTLSATLGSSYVNDFNYLDRSYKVIMQAESESRLYPFDIDKLFIRNAEGSMIPLSTLINVTIDGGPSTLDKFNTFTSARVNGSPATGYSSGQALQAIIELAKSDLPTGYTYAFSGTAYQELSQGGTNFTIFGLSILMVLLILAAQYEKWSLPLAVLSAVPFAIFGAIGINWAVGLANGVYTQVAIITLIGLASKNAILIVEFASELHKDGMSIREAAIEAARLRFRPIIMTSIAFILGCVPLILSSGAGAASRITIGLTVVCGMLCATAIAPMIVPYFFDRIMTLSTRKNNDESKGENIDENVSIVDNESNVKHEKKNEGSRHE